MGVVQHYAWGGYSFIPDLLGMNNSGQKPFAEYWLGAHYSQPALLEDQTSLAEYLKKNPLNPEENNHLENEPLPYLFKILDVRQMLSIQVHPGKKEAILGFEAEEGAGIPLKSPNRNYKDKNHKPELMVALGDFYLLHGFKPADKMLEILRVVPELNFLLQVFQSDNYRGLYEEVMQMPQDKVDEILQPLAERISMRYEKNDLRKNDENFWAARAIKEFCKEGHYDRGIFSIYLFNLVFLKRGEGIFQDHGLPHAYLEGQNVEVMANSDNVLRAGLTEKNIDVHELLKHVVFQPTIPGILNGGAGSHIVYPVPVSEFELHKYQAKELTSLSCRPGEIFWLEDGIARISTIDGNMELKRGEALFISRNMEISIFPEQYLIMYRVLIPGG